MYIINIFSFNEDGISIEFPDLPGCLTCGSTIEEAIGNQSVKKTLTIPRWLNNLAEQNSINFSQILQMALKDKLHLKP